MGNPTYEIAASGAIPALVAMWLVDRLDAKRPEPPRLRRAVAFGGMLSVLPAIVIELALGNSVGSHVAPAITYQGATFQSFIVAAFVEEACKLAVVYWLVWRRPEFDERMDGIVYASRAGLGFALVENVLYLLNQQTLGGQLTLWVTRAVLVVPGHAMWTGMAGAMIARRRFDGRGLGLAGGYLLAVAFHGATTRASFCNSRCITRDIERWSRWSCLASSGSPGSRSWCCARWRAPRSPSTMPTQHDERRYRPHDGADREQDRADIERGAL